MQKGEVKSCIAEINTKAKNYNPKILRSYKAKWKTTTVKSAEMYNYSKKVTN